MAVSRAKPIVKTEKFKPAGIRVAVIADTHGNLPDSAANEISFADEIWHLGDFCDLSILARCRSLGPEFYAVLGNNDFGLDLPRSLRLERLGHSFFLTHIPPAYPGGAEFVLHGHTHLPRDEQIPSTRILNPGSIGKADKGAPASFGWLTITASAPPDWRIARVR